jgi:hypothetical protein
MPGAVPSQMKNECTHQLFFRARADRYVDKPAAFIVVPALVAVADDEGRHGKWIVGFMD